MNNKKAAKKTGLQNLVLLSAYFWTPKCLFYALLLTGTPSTTLSYCSVYLYVRCLLFILYSLFVLGRRGIISLRLILAVIRNMNERLLRIGCSSKSNLLAIIVEVLIVWL